MEGETTVTITGPRGELRRTFRPEIKINFAPETGLQLAPLPTAVEDRALWGTYAAHLKNMVSGVVKGFEKKLILEGVGYRMAVEGASLKLNIGLSHPVLVPIPQGLALKVDKNLLEVSGCDCELVGQFAARLRALRPPEPYKGKGFRYEGEVIRRKQGKKVVA